MKNNFLSELTCLFKGGMYLSSLVLSMEGNISFTENQASRAGGALAIVNPTFLTISGAAFTANVAESGGAVSMAAVENRERRFTGCSFKGNEAVDGGGMYLYTSAGYETIEHSTFSGNLGGMRGGGVM